MERGWRWSTQGRRAGGEEDKEVVEDGQKQLDGKKKNKKKVKEEDDEDEEGRKEEGAGKTLGAVSKAKGERHPSHLRLYLPPSFRMEGSQVKVKTVPAQGLPTLRITSNMVRTPFLKK
jgi:hypothetical protein